MNTETEFSLLDIYYGLFFIFFIKTTSDVHKYFVTSPHLSYTFSTDISHVATIKHICYALVLANSAIWFLFSGLYLIVLYSVGIPIYYPFEYLMFTLAIFSSIFVGFSVSLHFFSAYQYRLIPTILLLIFFWFSQSMIFLIFVFPLIILHFIWSIHHGMDSYLYIKRKQRNKETNQAKARSILFAIFYKEITTLWRERLLISFVFTAISTALFSGYFAVYGIDLLIPESLLDYAGDFLPNMFVFLGIYIVVIYTGVFPTLNMFLNEEKTFWILRNMPLSSDHIVQGKILSLSVCFCTAIPFVAYLSWFIGLDDIFFVIWFFIFSYIAAIIVAAPFGAKYVGKKSDILLLYSVAMILFGVLGIVGNFGFVLLKISGFGLLYLLFLLLLDVCFLYGSMKFSAKIIDSK
ncbi:MAG: hypothetical protein R6V50_04485 [Thermoplasmatota archaeon]